MNEVIPSPSQPSNNAIKLGTKIKVNIDATNNITSTENRLINGSSPI